MKSLYAKTLLIVALFVGAGFAVMQFQSHTTPPAALASTSNSELAVATLAGGCFWCVESTFEKLHGVSHAVSGYSGGHTPNPTYREVGGGGTGHTEVVQIHYDPNVISYEGLLHYFWREIDPTDAAGQFVDRGDMYRPAIFYHNEDERRIAEKSRDALAASGRFDKPIAVEITPLDKFHEAESYHQDYYKTNPYRYKIYRRGSGRDQFLRKVWGEDLDETFRGHKSAQSAALDKHPQYKRPSNDEIKARLTPMQFYITQEDGTERPFDNEFWNNKADGIYVDVVSGEPLFSSTDKYRSGTGWPSFTRPLDEQFITEHTDYKLLFPRIEVRSKFGDSHLGHVFNDGPAPTGLRYCINSGALRFIAKQELAAQGYGEYARLFAKADD